uniref:Uncharacterized protein n=1 Tax=Acrobeloides nanus TaxID=290746 RepID=A0A914D506_9BILA
MLVACLAFGSAAVIRISTIDENSSTHVSKKLQKPIDETLLKEILLELAGNDKMVKYADDKDEDSKSRVIRAADSGEELSHSRRSSGCGEESGWSIKKIKRVIVLGLCILLFISCCGMCLYLRVEYF